MNTYNMEDTMFPKYQYSIFDKNGVDAQWVVRGNNWEEFLLQVEAVKAKVQANLEKHNPIMASTQDVVSHPCKTCGGQTEYKSGTSKAGKEWKGYFCKQSKDHVEWVR